jgi:chromatin segregation and condensation protein Rec8/ScpA/Scc1 (kleisin family)
MVVPDVVPVERLRIPPERLAAAFRSVLERLALPEPISVGLQTFSVEEKAQAILGLLHGRDPLGFEELFADVATRLEAVALFLGLLELLRAGRIVVEQSGAFGPIMVSSRG